MYLKHIIADHEEDKLFAVPFVLNECQEIAFGCLNMDSLKYLLSKVTFKHTDHNFYLLHNSRLIETFKVYNTQEENDSYMFLVGYCDTSSNESIETSPIPSIDYFALSRILQVRMLYDSNVANKFLNLFSSTYKSYSFGSRHRSSCLGMNIYSGTRGTKHIRPSSRMCVSTRMRFQYTNAM